MPRLSSTLPPENASSYVSAPSYSYDDDVEIATSTYDYSYDDSYESLAGVATIGDETAFEIMQAERQQGGGGFPLFFDNFVGQNPSMDSMAYTKSDDDSKGT